MIPVGTSLPTRRLPWMNYLIILATVAVWILVQGGGANPLQLATTVCNLGMVPGELTHSAPIGMAVPLGQGLACVVDNDAINILTPVISIFLHGSWMHLLGNMLFLWVFGRNIEDSMGHGRYLAFYLICGVAAALAQIASDPASPVPTVGASGAISGVMGAFLVLYPNVRVKMFFFIILADVRAWLVLIYWFLLQVFEGLATVGPMRNEVSGGVAVWAHVGGFLAGLVLIKMFTSRGAVAPYGGRG
ncbi:MAG: rhomboid family intramembrane serine protease [Gemmatimonadota bacterium]|nr:rhomboid family intramembrane serine protease [Gemmatimonadota bacterium]